MKLRAPVLMAIIAVLVSLSPLLISCSSEGSKGHPGEGRGAGEDRRAGATPGGQTGALSTSNPSKNTHGPEQSAALVPITHLSSTLEDVSTQELSKARGLAVARLQQEEAGELLGRSEFESFDSAGAVVNHVSRTPGALGLVPWDEVGPNVKALAVDGQGLLDPDTAPKDYALSPDSALGPDRDELRRVVVGGDIVFDRGQNYMDIQRGMGIDFSLDGGYAAVTSRVPEHLLRGAHVRSRDGQVPVLRELLPAHALARRGEVRDRD